jgi:hypothetical protein
MKKMSMLLTGVLSLGIVAGGAVAVRANSTTPDRPAWVTADGKADLSKMPDNTKIPYECWSGKRITLEGKTIKQREVNAPMPGSAEHNTGVAKMKELKAIPGVVTQDGKGGEIVTIDDTNPRVASVMKKYEAKEYPQCQ